MNIDNLKLAWQQLNSSAQSPASLQLMLRENKHPVLRNIRRQLLIETIAWLLFLVGYYDAFDGDCRPLYVHLLLVIPIVLMLTHNLLGYLAAKKPVAGLNIKTSLEKYLVRLQQFSRLAITVRAIAVGLLLLFLLYPVQFTPAKYWILAGLLLIIPVQVYLLYKVWKGRIRKIQQAVASLQQTM